MDLSFFEDHKKMVYIAGALVGGMVVFSYIHKGKGTPASQGGVASGMTVLPAGSSGYGNQYLVPGGGGSGTVLTNTYSPPAYTAPIITLPVTSVAPVKQTATTSVPVSTVATKPSNSNSYAAGVQNAYRNAYLHGGSIAGEISKLTGVNASTSALSGSGALYQQGVAAGYQNVANHLPANDTAFYSGVTGYKASVPVVSAQSSYAAGVQNAYRNAYLHGGSYASEIGKITGVNANTAVASGSGASYQAGVAAAYKNLAAHMPSTYK